MLRDRVLLVVVPLVSVVAPLAAWEIVSRAGLVSARSAGDEHGVPGALVADDDARVLWVDYWETVRGWLIGVVLATVLAVPIGILLGSSDFLGSAFRVPIELLRPIPSAALDPGALPPP